MKRILKNIFLTFFLILSPVIIFLGAEGVVRLKNALKSDDQPQKSVYVRKRLKVTDDILFFKDKHILNDKVEWDVDYKIIRDLDIRFFEKEQKQNLPLHFNFLGGSFIFGQNLEFENTLPAIIKELRPNYFVQNIGYAGGGIPDALMLLERAKDYFTREEVPKKGQTVYLFIPDHVGRTILDMGHLGDMSTSPYYKVEKGEARFIDSYNKVFPYRSKFYRFLRNFELLRYLNFNPPVGDYQNLSADHRYELCLYMEALKNKALKTWPQTQFTMVFLSYEGVIYKQISHCLKEKNIHSVHTMGLFKEYFENGRGHELFFTDEHPKAIHNKILAKKLLKALGL